MTSSIVFDLKSNVLW